MLKDVKVKMPLTGMPYLSFLVFINTIGNTMLIPIFPIYIKNLIGGGNNSVSAVGYIFTIIAVLFFIYNFVVKKLLNIGMKKITLLKIGFIGTGVTLLILTVISNIKQFLILELFRGFFLVATILTMSLFVREYTSIKSIGKTEGQYFTILNIAFLIGPLIGGLLAAAYGFNALFTIVAIIKFIICLIIARVPLQEAEVKHTLNPKFLDYFKNKELRLLYLIQFGLLCWFVLLYAFLPLYASENNFSPKVIGAALFVAVIPLILLEFPIGKRADIYGYKKYISAGFTIIGAMVLFTYFADPLLAIGIIAVATTGAAFIEPLIEAYFFTAVKNKEKEESYYPVYKSSQEVSQIIYPMIASTILLYFSFKLLFVITGLFMLFLSFISLKLER